MSEEQQDNREEHDKVTVLRAWRLGGPLTAAQRKEAKLLFIEYLKNDHNITFACDYAGVSRQTVYKWREHDNAFADIWEDTLERAKDIARSSIYKRGILGWDEPLVSQGQPVYEYEPVLDERGEQVYERGKPAMRRGLMLTTHKWSDSLASLYAKANLPEYKEKQQIDLNAQITTMAETAKDELLADLAAAIANENKEPLNQE